MKSRIFLLGLTFILLFGVIGAAAQNRKRLDSSPRAFQAFYAKFRTAVVGRKKMSVTAMTQFPMRYAFDAGNEGEMSRAEFLAKYETLFDRETRKFFVRRNPWFAIDGRNLVVSTEDASHFVFVKTRAGYKLSSYLIEP